jgi:hypothetical protein
VPLDPPAPPVVEPPRPAVAPGLVEPLAPAKPLLPPVPLARPPAPLLPTARQLPCSQTASAEHAVPHRPQLDGSNLVSVHTPSHNEMPGPHEAPFSRESGLRTLQPPRRPAATAIANGLRIMRLRNHIRPPVAIPGYGDHRQHAQMERRRRLLVRRQGISQYHKTSLPIPRPPLSQAGV